jgi:hypothetical protein
MPLYTFSTQFAQCTGADCKKKWDYKNIPLSQEPSAGPNPEPREFIPNPVAVFS